MDLKKILFQVGITKKEEKKKGLFFKKPAYFISLKINDDRCLNNPTIKTEIPHDQYCNMHIGQEFQATFYSANNGKTWYLKEQDAMLEEATLGKGDINEYVDKFF